MELVQGDYFDDNLRHLTEKLDVEVASHVNEKDQQTEKWTKAMEMLVKRIIDLEKFIDIDSAAGSKRLLPLIENKIR